MAAGVKYYCMAQNIGRGVYNLHTDTIKAALSNAAPNVSTHAVLADVTEISAGNGYSAGGAAFTSTSFTQSGGTATLAATGPTITASGGTVGPFRYVIVYDSTAAGGPLMQYYDYGSSITLASGESLALTVSTSLLTET